MAEGAERRIKCTAVSGNPLPTLEWFAGDTKLANPTVDRGESEAYVSAEIRVTIDRSDNERVYECRGHNAANPKQPVTRRVNMTVVFPPRLLNITVSPAKPVEGEPAVLTCVTDTSRPGVTMRWRYNGELVDNSTGGISTELEQPGPYGGLVTTSKLSINVTTQHVGAVFTCEATHDPSQTTVHNSTVLTIKCK